MNRLLFVTTNSYKFQEANKIVRLRGARLIQLSEASVEIQSINIAEIVKAKTIDAFVKVGRPLFVEHTSLHIDYLNGFPAGYTEPFLRHFGDDKTCALFGDVSRNVAVGRTTIGYCDGREIHQFVGELHGIIAPRPDGIRKGWQQFGWSRIFIPIGYNVTLSRLGMQEKNRISMRRTALMALLNYLGF